jgi:hypothetical protein
VRVILLNEDGEPVGEWALLAEWELALRELLEGQSPERQDLEGDDKPPAFPSLNP